jgi:hypothetical protein
MPLDHYISQVHLKNFCSPVLGSLMYAIRKSDLKRFPCGTRDVCRIEEGSTNAYLTNDRAIEDFLRDIEPRYNASVAKLREGQINTDAIYVLAGFTAFVTSCTPAAMRIHSGPLKSMLEAEAVILDRQGIFGPAPEALGGKSLTELLDDGTVHFTVDEKYPQALGISLILQRLSVFGNSPWEILRNEEPDSPYFTSDFPVAIEPRRNSEVVNRIVPLAPDIALRIIPDVELSRSEPDLSFAKFRFRRRRLDRSEILELNRLIVRCAEDTVFYRDDHKWIAGFVAKNRNYRIESITRRVPHGSGFLSIASQRVVARRNAA